MTGDTMVMAMVITRFSRVTRILIKKAALMEFDRELREICLIIGSRSDALCVLSFKLNNDRHEIVAMMIFSICASA